METLHARCVEVGECWDWQGSRSGTGHPMTRHDGKAVLVRRLIAELSGKPIQVGKKAYMSCENPNCVNPEHISARTHKQIMTRQGALGKLSDPTRIAKIAATKRAGPQAKLSMEIVREIRAATTTHEAEAKKRGVHPSKIASIRAHRCWRELHNNPWVGLGERK